ncbi:MAG: hypothetical protein KBF48_02430 [Xanthomonadales bacterium]|nr:hypothetical protein [Xanthomonadales bacterium]
MTNPRNTNAQAGWLGRSGQHRIGQDRLANHTGTPPDVNILLSRLERVRQFGKGWSARCPAHDDRQASLSVTVGDDGRILAHCFAGCAIGDVLGAVGLALADLFPARIRDDSPDGRRELREAARQAQWRAALGVLAFEASIVSIAAYDVLRGRLSDADAHRVAVALERIDAARVVLQ